METKQGVKRAQSATAAERSTTALVRSMVDALVDDLGAVSVSSRTNELGTHFAVRVAPTDVGKLIGKQGRTARSMRVILGAAAMKLGTRFSLDLIEDGRQAADV